MDIITKEQYLFRSFYIILYVVKRMLNEIDQAILNCTKCSNMVEKFLTGKTISIGKTNDIVILGEAPANNGWRKSGIAWYDSNHKLLPSGVVMQRLLDLIDLKLEDTYFMEAIKCYPINRNYLKKCGENCRSFLIKQLEVIQPKVILSLGDAATKTILNIQYHKFGEVVGKEFFLGDICVIPIYHPSPISPKSYTGNVAIFQELKNRIYNR